MGIIPSSGPAARDGAVSKPCGGPMSIQMGQFRPFGMPREPDRVRWSPLKWLEKCGGWEVDQSLPAAASAAIGGQARHYLGPWARTRRIAPCRGAGGTYRVRSAPRAD